MQYGSLCMHAAMSMCTGTATNRLCANVCTGFLMRHAVMHNLILCGPHMCAVHIGSQDCMYYVERQTGSHTFCSAGAMAPAMVSTTNALRGSVCATITRLCSS